MTLRDKLAAFLAARLEGAPVEELIGLLFSSSNNDPELSHRIIQQVLGADPAFAYDPAHRRWSLVEGLGLRKPLAETQFVVVDLETRGGRPSADQIIEIGAYRCLGTRMLQSFQSLVRPARPIPSFITRMTSISNEAVAQAPTIGEILPRFRDFLGDAVLVAHNAQFDFSFLDFEFRRLLGAPLRNPVLCTLRLARRLLPSMRRRGLDALADHFGLATEGRHRGLGDARMAAELLAIFLEMLAVQGIKRLDLALEFTHSATSGRRMERHVPSEAIAAIPRQPGVYLMRNERGEVLYVGKARDLKRRVASYFNGGVGTRGKIVDLISHVWSVTTRTTRATLEAALLEAELIRELKPPYNRQLKTAPQAYFIRLDLNDPFARLSVATKLTARPGWLQLGPFIGRRHPRQAVEVLARWCGLRTCAGRLEIDPARSACIQGQIGHCTAPCNQTIDRLGYGRQLERALQFLRGRAGNLLNELAQARDQAAATMRFREAARYQRDLQTLQLLAIRERRLSQTVTENNLVIIEGESASVILSGRLAGRFELAEPDAAMRISRFVAENYARYQARPIAKAELEPMMLVSRWLKERRPDDGRLIFLSGANLPAEALAEFA
jgi:DNA polymerase-3 subunit epsilon